MPTVDNAYLSATNRVTVTLSEAPLVSGPYSAYVPTNWYVSPGTVGAQVVSVAAGSLSTQWLLTVHPAWTDVSTPSVQSGASQGYPGVRTSAATAAYASSAPFAAPLAETLQTHQDRRRAGLDFALHTIGGKRTASGCYAIEGGDYALWSQSSPQAREADILRRLRTPKGGFAWLRAYGVGLTPKRLLSVAAQLDAKREIHDQVRREPGVTQVGASLRFASSRRLIYVTVRIATVTGSGPEVAATLEG